MKTFLLGNFQAWFLKSWKGFFIVGAVLLTDELVREGYLFKISDIFVFRLTHEKFIVGTFLLRFGGSLFSHKTSV